MLTFLLVSLVAPVSAYNKGGPLLGEIVNGGVITSGPLLGGGGIIGVSGGIVGGGGLLLNGGGLGGLIRGINTGLIDGGQPWIRCSLKCAQGQIKLLNSLNTCCSLLPWWVTNQNYVASLDGGGIIGGGCIIGAGGIIGGVSCIVGGGSGLLGQIGGIGSPIGGIVTGPVNVVRGGSRVVGGSTGKGYYKIILR